MKTINLSNLTPVVLELTHEHKVKYHLHYPVTTLFDAVTRIQYAIDSTKANKPTYEDIADYLAHDFDTEFMTDDEFDALVKEYLGNNLAEWDKEIRDLERYMFWLEIRVPIDSESYEFITKFYNINL